MGSHKVLHRENAMVAKMFGMSLVIGWFVVCSSVGAQDQKKRTGTVIGEIKSNKDTPKGNNVTLEVLAPGEEKPRSYHVQYDPKVKGPVPSILKAVRAAKVGDRVELQWVDTNHGPAITSFQVLKKESGKEINKDKTK